MARTNTRADHKLRAEFKAQSKADNAVCWMDQMPIDYEADWDDYDNDDRFELDHYYPVSTHPELQSDPSNFRASHGGCNRARGNGAPSMGIGIPSRQWA